MNNVNYFDDHENTPLIPLSIGELVDNDWGDSSFEVLDPEGNRIAFFSPNISKEKYYKVKRN